VICIEPRYRKNTIGIEHRYRKHRIGIEHRYRKSGIGIEKNRIGIERRYRKHTIGIEHRHGKNGSVSKTLGSVSNIGIENIGSVWNIGIENIGSVSNIFIKKFGNWGVRNFKRLLALTWHHPKKIVDIPPHPSSPPCPKVSPYTTVGFLREKWIANMVKFPLNFFKKSLKQRWDFSEKKN